MTRELGTVRRGKVEEAGFVQVLLGEPRGGAGEFDHGAFRLPHEKDAAAIRATRGADEEAGARLVPLLHLHVPPGESSLHRALDRGELGVEPDAERVRPEIGANPDEFFAVSVEHERGGRHRSVERDEVPVRHFEREGRALPGAKIHPEDPKRVAPDIGGVEEHVRIEIETERNDARAEIIF